MKNHLHTSSCWECNWCTSSSVSPSRALLRPVISNLFGTRDWSVEDNFSMDGEQGWFRDDSSTLHLLCTLFLLLHQLYLTSSDTRSLRLGTSGLDWRELCISGAHPFLRQPTSNAWSPWVDRGLDSLLQCTIALRSIASLELCARSAEATIKTLLHSTSLSAQTGFLLFSCTGIDLKNSH